MLSDHGAVEKCGCKGLADNEEDKEEGIAEIVIEVEIVGKVEEKGLSRSASRSRVDRRGLWC
jgi:hypothetical protein